MFVQILVKVKDSCCNPSAKRQREMEYDNSVKNLSPIMLKMTTE